jgi:hypothetical protein
MLVRAVWLSTSDEFVAHCRCLGCRRFGQTAGERICRSRWVRTRWASATTRSTV